MTKQLSQKPVIFVSNIYSSGKGLLRTDKFDVIVEVFRKTGRASYDYAVDGRHIGRYCCEAETAYNELADYLGAELVIVDKKWLNKEIKNLEKGE